MINRIINFAKKDFQLKKNFIIIGLINTFFGYWIGILVFNLIYPKYGIFLFGIISNFLSITFSFMTQKIFVFKTEKRHWYKEYLKSFLVYGLSAIISFIIIFVCIEVLKLNIYISQAISILVATLIVYTAHKNYTFRNVK